MIETYRGLLRRMAGRLHDAGLPSPALDARVLLQHASGRDHASLVAGDQDTVPPGVAARFKALVARRLSGVPPAYLTGQREFWGLEIAVSAATLIPRGDTERLVEVALARWPGGVAEPPVIADIGTGTGCVLCALLVERADARGIGTDISGEALAIANANLARYAPGRARTIAGAWLAGLTGLDVVVSNPPYIRSADLSALDPHVGAEPMVALDGGPDGLTAYRALIPEASRALRPGGLLAVEIGRGQERDVAALMTGMGLGDVRVAADLAGIARIVSACRPA